MADLMLPERRSALAGILESGEFGAVTSAGAGVTLAERAPLSVVQIETRAGGAAALGKALKKTIGIAPSSEANKSVEKDGTRILGTGTDRWLVLEEESRDLAALLRGALPENVAVTDLGHARTCLRLSGRNARSLLSKGTGIDTHRASFGPETSRMTTLFNCAVLIDCRAADPVYELYVHRSYAVHLFEMLLDGALEYGCRIE